MVQGTRKPLQGNGMNGLSDVHFEKVMAMPPAGSRTWTWGGNERSRAVPRPEVGTPEKVM